MKHFLHCLVLANLVLAAPTLTAALDRAPPAQTTGPIKIIGSGSTGDASGLSVTTNGGAAIGTLASRLAVT